MTKRDLANLLENYVYLNDMYSSIVSKEDGYTDVSHEYEHKIFMDIQNLENKIWSMIDPKLKEHEV